MRIGVPGRMCLGVVCVLLGSVGGGRRAVTGPLRRSSLLLAAVLSLSACGERPANPSASEIPPGTEGLGAASAPPSGSAEASIERFAVDETGRELAIRCEGSGSPVVVLEDGHPSETGGIARVSERAILGGPRGGGRAWGLDRGG